MPITVWQPTSGGPFGQGMWVEVSSDHIGPIIGPYWTFEIRDSDHGNLWGLEVLQTSDWTQQQGRFWKENQYPFPPFKPAAHGETASLRVALNGATGLVEETFVPITMDYVTGAPYLLGQKIQLVDVRAQGLSNIQTPLLNNILSAVTVNFGSGVLGTIGQLLAHPPVGVLSRELIGDFDGQVNLQRPSGPLSVDAFGIAWEVVTYGGGIGLDPSTPVRFETDLLALEIVHTDGADHEFVSAAEVFDFSNFYYLFQTAFPTRVLATIAPSVTMRLYWLVLQI